SIFGLERLACQDNTSPAAPAVFWRSPAASNTAAPRAPRKILLRITANLTNVFRAAKSAPQRFVQTPMYRFYFPPGERDCRLADYSSTPAFVNLGRYVTQPKRCSADLGPT